jgi:hypothetical protein
VLRRARDRARIRQDVGKQKEFLIEKIRQAITSDVTDGRFSWPFPMSRLVRESFSNQQRGDSR